MARFNVPTACCGCPTAPPATIKGQNNGFIKDNYDRTLVVAIDGHWFKQPQMRVTVPAGKHFLLVRAIRMRGVYPRPHEADVPLFATFEPHNVYNVDSLEFNDRMGAALYTDDHLTLISEVDTAVTITAPAHTPSPERRTAEYSLECGGHTLAFLAPASWRAAPASVPNAIVFPPASSAEKTTGLQITVTPRTTRIDGLDNRAAQERLAYDYAAHLRQAGWQNAGILLEDRLTRPDGREILEWLELSNVRHLFSFVPLDDCIVEINMWGPGAAVESVSAKEDFATLVSSLRVR